MNHLSIFSGSGIGTLAAQAAGIVTVAHAENDPACYYCLERLWPAARLFRDVRDVTAASVADLGPIDIISGGFPCTDISTAGKGAGLGTEENPTRSGLWYEFARVIREVHPRYILVENVPALLVRGGDRVCADLEEAGYTWWAFILGAWAVGAPHKRDRVWIVGRVPPFMADSMSSGLAGRGATGRADGPEVADGSCEVMGHPASDDQRRAPVAAMHRAGEQAGGPGGGCGELADRDSTRLPQTVCERSDPREEQPAAIGSRWPARPGEPQHAWEKPRLSFFGLGGSVTGLARRVRQTFAGVEPSVRDRTTKLESALAAALCRRANKHMLRQTGNGWCYENAVVMFRAIVELDRMNFAKNKA